MISVSNNLYIGVLEDYEEIKDLSEWAVVHASKKAHKALLGYPGWAAPKDNPEYLYAERGSELTLNLVDPRDSKYIPVEIMDKAIHFIDDNIKNNKKVLVRCNHGKSRAPSIALLYMRYKGITPFDNFTDAEIAFKNDVYSQYEPGPGMRGFMLHNWTKYINKE